MISAGSVIADRVACPVKRPPNSGELELVEQISLQVGGSAASTGAQLVKLGLGVALVGRTGQGGFGDLLAAQPARLGLDTHCLVRDPQEATPATLAHVDAAGERSFLHAMGAGRALCAADLPLMLEPLWMGPPLGEAEHDEVIVHGVRMALELGADILNIPAVGENAMAQILTWGVPTVFLGGARQDDPSALLTRIRAGIAAGARGVVVGRNVWQRPRMLEMIEALRAAVGMKV